ncbi:MAG: TRAP transporter large permease subunit, partial [Sulfuricaulis sp.]|nr:TRAP transporter large permease subunit [Sulfuricaulis sp.]
MDYLPFFMLPVAFTLMFLGIQVAFSMMITAVLFGLVIFGDRVIFQFVEKIEDISSNFVFAAVPLFVFMGAMLEKSGIADKLFEAIHIWTRRLPGGLALATISMCVIFAASSGVIGATESVVGLLTIPIMLRYKYDKGLISGSICAGGSLGTIIPPSVVAVVMGPLANISVGDLLYGMVFPGLIMASMYLIYIFTLCTIYPANGPRIPPEPGDPAFAEKLWITTRNLVPPLFMIFAVLGSILLGWASPTEAAAIGALASVLLTMLYGRFNFGGLYEALIKTVKITTMIMTVLLAGTLFTGVFIGGGGINTANVLIKEMHLTPWMLLSLMMFIIFIAGFFLDWISIVLIFVPLFTPLITAAGFDP